MFRKFKTTIGLPLLLWMIVTLACTQPFAGLLGSPDEAVEDAGRDPAVIAQATFDLQADVRSTLGNLAEDNAAVDIPQNTFNSDVTLSMAYLSEPPGDGASQFTPLSPTLALAVDGEQTRFNEPVTISLKFDPGAVNGPGDVYAAYYDEAYGWHYFTPDEVDMEAGVMHFTTYHFSFWGAAQPTDEEIIDKFVTKQSTEQFVRQTQQDLANKQVEIMVQQIMEEGMGVYDNKTIEIITKAVLKEVPFGVGKIGIAIYENKPEDVMSVTLEETAKALGKALKDGTVADIAKEAGTVGAFAGAAGAYAEGDYEGALQIMANEILNNIPLVSTVKKAGEAAVAVADHWIQDQWKKPGMDKAYEVYATGVDKYGYDGVRAGDLDEVFEQMGPGLVRQIRIDYVKSYCNRTGCDPTKLSAEENQAIGNKGIELLKQQWEERYERRDEIERIKENNRALMEMFKDKGLLEMVPGRNPMYTGNEDLEMMMNRLNQMTQRILRDTGRTSFVTHSYDLDPDDPDSQLWGQDVADLVWIWYVNRPDSEAAYQQALIEKGLLVEVEEEDDGLIYGVEPQLVTCEGEYTWGVEIITADDHIYCKTTWPFSLEFWNVGELGGEEFGASTITMESNSIDFNCELGNDNTEIGTAVFSGGPNGTFSSQDVDESVFDLLQVRNGTSVSFEVVADGLTFFGSCNIANTEAFDGWIGP